MNFLEMQDLMELANIIKRMKSKSYDDTFAEEIRSMKNVDKAEGLVKAMMNSSDRRVRDNAKQMLHFIHDVESVKKDMNGSKPKKIRHFDGNSPKAAGRVPDLLRGAKGSAVDKFIFFLKSLNDD
jgi:hypothetical protein